MNKPGGRRLCETKSDEEEGIFSFLCQDLLFIGIIHPLSEHGVP